MRSASMTNEEREEFLSQVHVAVMAIERQGRAPLTLPIWYGYQPGGEIKILTGPDTLKAQLLAKAGRFSLCVQTESIPYRYVTVEGPIVETRQCDIEVDARTIAHRYLGQEMGDRFIADGDEGSNICILMRPDHWYSVDYGKVG